MTIRSAAAADFREVSGYDCHIPADRLIGCIENGQVYVLEDDGGAIGTLRYSLFWQTIPFLDLLFIDERYRGRGHGTRAMAYWEQQMAALGFDHVMLSTQADETARDFYEKLGYRRIGAFLPPDQDADELMYLKKLQ